MNIQSDTTYYHEQLPLAWQILFCISETALRAMLTESSCLKDWILIVCGAAFLKVYELTCGSPYNDSYHQNTLQHYAKDLLVGFSKWRTTVLAQALLSTPPDIGGSHSAQASSPSLWFHCTWASLNLGSFPTHLTLCTFTISGGWHTVSLLHAGKT